MDRLFALILGLFFILTGPSHIAIASTQEDFSINMQTWNQKKELASQYLEEAENQFKNGDELAGCVAQQQAGDYGIEATESLIKAMELNGSTDGIENLRSGLNKWRELRDFC